MGGITLIKGIFAKVEYSSSGAGDWRAIPGLTEYSESGGDRPTEDIVTFDGSASISGQARTPEITAQAQYLPNHKSWIDLRAAFVGGEPLWFRITTQEENVWVGDTDAGITIASTGNVTLQGANTPDFTLPDFAPGMVIKSGVHRLTIDRISESGAAAVEPSPRAQVLIAPNTGYSIVTPSIRREFRADVSITDRMTVNAEGTVTTPVTLKARAQLSQATLA